METKSRRGVQSVEIAYRILRAVQIGNPFRMLKDIAADVGMTPSAVNNYLVSLQRTGLVRSNGRGSYGVGPSALSLGLVALRQIDGFEIVRDGALALRDASGLTVTVTTWSDEGAVVVFKQDGPGYGPLDIRPGMLLTPFDSAAGLAFVCALDPATTATALQQYKSAEQRRELTALRAEFMRKGFTRKDLYGHTAGYRAYAAPIYDDSASARYVLAVMAPRPAFKGAAADRHASALLAATRRLTLLLGGRAHAIPDRSIAVAASQ